MRAALVALVWFSLLACAADLRVPPRLEADDGSFASIPLEFAGATGPLDVEYPPGFKPLSLPETVRGRALVNFYVSRGTLSGEYPIRFRYLDERGRERQAVCTIFVRPRTAFAVETPPGKEALLGGQVRYWIGVVNSGNVDDEITIEMRVRDKGVVVEPSSLKLSAGGRGGFLLTVRPRVAQPLVIVAALHSRRDPGLVKYVSIRTDVLPFAGAGDLGSRALRYRIEASGGPGSEGWSYGLQAAMGGMLSDYVYGSVSAAYTPGRPRLGASFSGDWGELGLRASASGYEAYAASGEWKGSLRYVSDVLSGRLDWRPGSWRFGIGGAYNHQRFSVGKSISLGKWLHLEPNVFIERYGDGGYVEPGGELSLTLDSPYWLMNTRFTYRGGMFSAAGEVSRRRGRDYSVRGHWFYSGGTLGASLEAGEALGNGYWISQSLSFLRGDVGWRFGLRYAGKGVPWQFGLALAGTNLSPGGYGSITYRQQSWESGASIGWSALRGLSYGLRATFREEGTELTLSYSRASKDVLGVRVNHLWKEWQVSGSYDYSFTTGLGSGAAEIVYDAGNWSIKSGLKGNATGVRWWLTGSLRIEGGFKTPETVVQAFGGRKTGRVWGVVYVDENKNGRFDEGERKIVGAFVSCGPARALSDGDGRYSLESQPSECLLDVQDPDGRYGLPGEKKLEFSANSNRHFDLGLVPVAGVTGFVWFDGNENGVRDEGERTLPGVEVLLTGPDGFTATTRSDARGRFAISYLPPGHYRLSLQASSLARLQQPGRPVEVDLQPGPLPFVALAVLPRELRKVQTFTLGDAVVYIDQERQTAPPGAVLPLRVTVSGMDPDDVFVESGGQKERLHPAGDGVYAGYLRIPDNAAGAFFYRVVARSSAGEAQQEAMLVVRPGPLARLTVQPAFVDPGAEVTVTARLLMLVDAAEIVIDGRVLPLERRDEFTWEVRLKAPAKPGRYPVELRIDGEKQAETAFRVAE